MVQIHPSPQIFKNMPKSPESKDSKKLVLHYAKTLAQYANLLEDLNIEKSKYKFLAKDLEKFKLALDNISDNIIITDIYDVAGREEKNINQKINSELLVKKINKKNVQYANIIDAEKYVKGNVKNGEVVIIMGAGDVYKLADRF